MILNEMEQGFLKKATWDFPGNLALTVDQADGNRQFAVAFVQVRFLKILASRSSHGNIDNEIWKIEVVTDSPLLKDVLTEQGVNWLPQWFGGQFYRTSSLDESQNLSHIVFLSDYLDLELLCVEYDVSEIVSADSSK